MLKFNKLQAIGFSILFLGITIYMLNAHMPYGIISGILCGVGVTLIFKLVGVKK